MTGLEAVREKREERKEKLLEILEAQKGLISSSCRILGINRQTYYNWCRDDKDFAEKAKEIIECVGDLVESKLISLIEKGEVSATIFYCKTKLKSRGYVERIESTGNNGGPLTIDVSPVSGAIEERITKLVGSPTRE